MTKSPLPLWPYSPEEHTHDARGKHFFPSHVSKFIAIYSNRRWDHAQHEEKKSFFIYEKI